ncbi:tyrosine-type recombinase/integrase [Thioalkalivibrio sp. ALJ8]|uniref:tyrosine-type recombinase/integrase n=1 Tax=Thioalkalivibrio sp. ALJ8 TaxID=1158757 RepID=UPI00036A1EFF|nr:tyrosine-type recombinase/integrase [Thioalkalivibrio sp. ALJ8]
MRPRKQNRHLPPCVYQKHGAYWYVKKGKWNRLGTELHSALIEYARLTAAQGSGMPALIDRAWPEITRDLKPNTVKQYRYAADQLKNILVEFEPGQVTPRVVAEIRQHYAATPNMANRIISFLRQVMHYAVENQIVESNPAVGLRRLKEKQRDRYLTDAEYRAIRAHASGNLRPIIDICYLTGQRISDILAIRLADISDEGIRFTQQKTGARLLIEMTDDMRAAIDAAKALPRKVRGLTLFCTMRGGRPYSYYTVRTMWNTAAERAGVQDAHLHDLRAKAITDAKNQGLDPQALSGHTTEAQTNRYIRARDTVRAKPPSIRQLSN